VGTAQAVTVLHLVRPESGTRPEGLAAHQAKEGDQVVVLRWRDGDDARVACDVLAGHHEMQAIAGTTLSYGQLLDLLFESERVFCW
jgi:hypothetical protein